MKDSNTGVLGLQWSAVDLARRKARVHSDQTKDGEAIGVPLNDKAMAVLREEIGRYCVRVFTFKGGRSKACRRVDEVIQSWTGGPEASKSGADKNIVFVGGKKVRDRTEAPATSGKARTGALRHDPSNIQPGEKI